MLVSVIEPGRRPEVREIDSLLKTMQDIVCGLISLDPTMPKIYMRYNRKCPIQS